MHRGKGYHPDYVDSQITAQSRRRGMSEDEFLKSYGRQYIDPGSPAFKKFTEFLQIKNGMMSPPALDLSKKIRTRYPDEVQIYGRYNPSDIVNEHG